MFKQFKDLTIEEMISDLSIRATALWAERNAVVSVAIHTVPDPDHGDLYAQAWFSMYCVGGHIPCKKVDGCEIGEGSTITQALIDLNFCLQEFQPEGLILDGEKITAQMAWDQSLQVSQNFKAHQIELKIREAINLGKIRIQVSKEMLPEKVLSDLLNGEYVCVKYTSPLFEDMYDISWDMS